MKLYELTPLIMPAFACNILTMAAFNRITAWRLKPAAMPKISKSGRGFATGGQCADGVAGAFFRLAADVAAGVGRDAVGGYPRLNQRQYSSLFMAHFRSDGGSATLLMSGSSLNAALMAGWPPCCMMVR